MQTTMNERDIYMSGNKQISEHIICNTVKDTKIARNKSNEQCEIFYAGNHKTC